MKFFGIANEWERHGIFTLGRFSRFVGPGIYFYVPFIQSVKKVVDTRIVTYTAPLQRGLTKDNIPVEVDAIVFYKTTDEKAAVLEVDDFHNATQLSCRSAIRDMVGKSNLDELLSERDKIGSVVRDHVDTFTARWGVSVISVEIKDVIVAKELEDAISREAAAEREKRARIRLSEAEVLAADSIVEASKRYNNNETALKLRSMNMLYEMCMEGKSTMIFVPLEDQISMPGVLGMKDLKSVISGEGREAVESGVSGEVGENGKSRETTSVSGEMEEDKHVQED